jgi:hypothetical protein
LPKNHVNLNFNKKEARKIGETAEVNIFKDDNTVLHFKKPNLEYSVKEKVTFLTGKAEQKRKN